MSTTPTLIRVIRWGVCILVLAAIVAGLYVSGSPATQRRYAFDERRVNSLNQLSQGIDNYANKRGGTPPTVDALIQDQPYLATDFRDPATNTVYEYIPLAGSTSTYDLCATFDLPAQQDGQLFTVPRDYWQNPTFQTHGAGRTCFTLHVRINPTDIKPIPAAP